jgi:BASS family bile acid:Na+ symporter
MMGDVLKLVIVPVLAGVSLNTWQPKQVNRIKVIFPLVAIAVIVSIIAIIVAINHAQIVQVAETVMIGIVLHNALGLTGGYFGARAFKLDKRQARTIAIGVGMQNSGLAVALALKYFTAAAALPGALFSIWHNVSGATLACYWKNNCEDGACTKK